MKLALRGEGKTISKEKFPFLYSIDTKTQRKLLEQQLQQSFPEHLFYDLPETILTLGEILTPYVMSRIKNKVINDYIIYIYIYEGWQED